MGKFKSQKVSVPKQDQYIYNILSDMNNLKAVIPPQVKHFKSTSESCSFKIEDFTELNLTFAEKEPYSKISIKSENIELPFTLNCYLSKIDNNNTQIIIELSIKLNMMMKMMLGGKLQEFVDTVSDRIKNI